MANGKGKNGAGNGVGNSVFLYKVNADEGTAVFVRLQIGGTDQEGSTLAPTSSNVIRDITEEVLDTCPEQFRPAVSQLVKKLVRSRVHDSEAFVPVEVNFEEILAELGTTSGKKGKRVKDEEWVEEEDEDVTGDAEPVTEEVVTGAPWQA